MNIVNELYFLSIWLEGFLYGLYSGIFAMDLQCHWQSKKTATILFYAICLLYILSTATFVSDLVHLTLTRVGTLSPRLQIESLPMLFHISVIQTTANGCCDFLAQCILIYRCWIVWGKNVRVVIIPSILAITYLAAWLAQFRVGEAGSIFIQGAFQTAQAGSNWGYTAEDTATRMTMTGLVISIAVNALVTGLIVFKILKVFNPTLVELTLDSTGGAKLRHVIFVVIESGMTLFAIQLVRLVLTILAVPVESEFVINTLNYVIVIHQALNGIAPTIILLRVSMSLSFDDTGSFKEVSGSLRFNNNLPSDPNTSSSMPPQLGPQAQERSEDTTT